MRSTDGGKTWTGCAARPAATTTRTSGSTRTIRRSSCSSAIRARSSRVNGGETWSTWYNQPTAQLYHVVADNAFPVSGVRRPAGERLGLHREPRATTARSPFATGIRSASSNTATPRPIRCDPDIVYGAGRTEVSRYHWSHRPGAERHADPAARSEIPRGPHAADHVLAGRSARPLLRGERLVQDDRRRQDLADDQPRSDARDVRACRQRVGDARLPRAAAEAARRDLLARAVFKTPTHICGPAPTTARSGSRATAARTGTTSRRPADAVEQGHAARRFALR